MNNFNIRLGRKNDLEEIISLFDALSPKDRKFLAIEKKLSLIRQNIRNERHVFVAELDGQIVGFARESGRPNKYIMLEEIAIHPDYREKGIGSKLFESILERYPRIEAKSLAKNVEIEKLFEKHGVRKEKISPKGEIIYWRRD